MRFCDVAGAPGCGKSTLCYAEWADKSVTWDGLLPPAYWRQFLDEVTSLMILVRDHASFEAVVRMNDRSAKKMSTVERMTAPADKPVFIQTGLIQRILGFGWRLKDLGRDVNLIRTALWRMPVSVGAVFLEADLATIIARNKARESVKETAYENRSYQVPLMLEPIRIAKEVLRERGVPIIEIDVEHQSVERAREQLVIFASREVCTASKITMGCDLEVTSPPPWWR